jgi:hypothetical protein
MEYEEHREALLKYLDRVPDPRLDISEALYSFSEMGILPDGLTVSHEQAVMIWRLIESVRLFGFPEHLEM